MSKIKIDNNAFTYPMPMTLVGAMVGDKPNRIRVLHRRSGDIPAG